MILLLLLLHDLFLFLSTFEPKTLLTISRLGRFAIQPAFGSPKSYFYFGSATESAISMSPIIFVLAAILPIFTTAQTLTANVSPPPIAVLQIQEIFTLAEARLEEEVFVYEAAEAVWLPSDTYTLAGFAKGLQVMYETGFGTGLDRRFFYLGDGSANSYKYGVANIAAFLSQVMKESLRYNACDENSWDLVSTIFDFLRRMADKKRWSFECLI